MRAASAEHLTSRFWISWAARDIILIGALGTIAVTGSSWRLAQPSPVAPSPVGAAQPVNTDGLQKQSDADRELARKVRKAIVDDKSLSAYAHNITIAARNGVVILKGTVRSEEEKSAIDSKATEIAGASNVKDELAVKSDE
jgi:osmotically-inducible protein OsmY